jgi:hypothetical protein
MNTEPHGAQGAPADNGSHADAPTHEPTHESKSPTYKDQVSRAVAVVGLIAILLIGAWGIIQIVFNLPGVLARVGSFFEQKPDPEVITLTLPSLATSGEAFTAAWTHKNKGEGNYMYSLSFACTEGLSLKAPAPNGSLQDVPCATPFNYTNATSQMQLTPTVKGNSQLKTTFTVSAITLANGTTTATHTAGLTILPVRSKTPATTSTRSTTRTTNTGSQTQNSTWDRLEASGQPAVVSNRPSNPAGMTDLAVSISGIIPLSGNMYSVRFVVENVGTKLSPNGWTFDAKLPVGYDYTYRSGSQQALYPGDKIMYSLTFSGAPYGGYNNCYPQTQQTYPTYYQPTYSGSNPFVYQPSSLGYSIYGSYQSGNCYSYGGTYGNNLVRIVVDPESYVVENNRHNNTATASVPGY